MKKFLDPVANAKTLGFLFILLGVVNIIKTIDGIVFFIMSIIFFAVGFGLRKLKLWAVYAVGVAAVLDFGFSMYALSQGAPFTLMTLLGTVFYGGLFLWLLSAKNKFKN